MTPSLSRLVSSEAVPFHLSLSLPNSRDMISATSPPSAAPPWPSPCHKKTCQPLLKQSSGQTDSLGFVGRLCLQDGGLAANSPCDCTPIASPPFLLFVRLDSKDRSQQLISSLFILREVSCVDLLSQHCLRVMRSYRC